MPATPAPHELAVSAIIFAYMASHDEEKDEAAKLPLHFLHHDDHSTESFSEKDDLAAAIVSVHAQVFDQATERRVVRKIDKYLMTWMWLGYGFVYYDKVC